DDINLADELRDVGTPGEGGVVRDRRGGRVGVEEEDRQGSLLIALVDNRQRFKHWLAAADASRGSEGLLATDSITSSVGRRSTDGRCDGNNVAGVADMRLACVDNASVRPESPAGVHLEWLIITVTITGREICSRGFPNGKHHDARITARMRSVLCLAKISSRSTWGDGTRVNPQTAARIDLKGFIISVRVPCGKIGSRCLAHGEHHDTNSARTVSSVFSLTKRGRSNASYNAGDADSTDRRRTSKKRGCVLRDEGIAIRACTRRLQIIRCAKGILDRNVRHLCSRILNS